MKDVIVAQEGASGECRLQGAVGEVKEVVVLLPEIVEDKSYADKEEQEGVVPVLMPEAPAPPLESPPDESQLKNCHCS